MMLCDWGAGQATVSGDGPFFAKDVDFDGSNVGL